ncbi:MAG: BrxA/BrxB family bacilliredoxin [Acidobacteriota bacterium]|jgi:putative YphP/YqiW family bacilliredoxin
MPYPEEWVAPARQELEQIGVRELRTAADVDSVLTTRQGTTLVVVNSICGCAAGSARPAIAAALEAGPRPDVLTSVFAGQDLEATQRAREYLRPQPPSSPSIALFREGRLVYMMHRQQIEGRTPEAIAKDLREAFGVYCAPTQVE